MAKPPVPPKTKEETNAEQETVCKAWKKRVEDGTKNQKEWVEEGRSFKKFIKGSCWNDMMDQQLPDSQWSKTTANRMHALVNGYLATTVYRRPNVNAKPPKAGDEMLNRAIVDATYLNYCLRECKAEESMYLATYDAVVYGAGFCEQRLDKERGGIARMDWVSAEDIVVDPHSNTTISSCAWMARRFTMNIHTARRVFKNEHLKADAQAMNEGPNSVGKKEAPASQHVGGGVEGERITLWRIWARGDDPSVDDAEKEDDGEEHEPKGEETPESELQEYLKKSGNRRFILSMNHDTMLEDTPWPFVLDHDEFPITIFRIHRVPGELLPYSPLRPVKELQKQLNWALTFLITQMRRTSQVKYVVDKSAFPGIGNNEIEKLTSLESEEVIISQGPLDRAMQAMKLEPLSQAPLMMLGILQEQFDTVSGFAEMFGGVENSRSASEAVIKQERAETLTDLMRQATEAGATECMRHMLQMSWSATPIATVLNIVGDQKLAPVIDRTSGQPVPISEYWDEEMTPDQIRAEVDVVIEPGSMRRPNRDQEMQDIFMMLDKCIGIGAQFPAMGLQPNPESWLKFVNGMLRKGYESMGWVDGSQYLIPPEAVGLMPQPEGNQSLAIDQSTHLTEGNKTLHEAAPTTTLHEASPSLSLSFKEGNAMPASKSKTQAAQSGVA